jgi:Peptidase A4 family
MKSQNQLFGESLKLVPTNLDGAYGIELPPKGFNPLKARPDELLRYGFPLCPDEKQSPKGAQIWRRALSRQLTHVAPQLRQRPELRRGPSGTAGLNSGPWSGGVLLAGGPFETIFGQWTVPSVMPGATGDGDWWSVAWIGIDGWNSPDVLQAGTGQHASRKNGTVTTEYFAWYEWFPNSWTEITNLPVHPGDAISVIVRYLGIVNGKPQGSAAITNITTGVSTTVTFFAPTGTALQGNCAEWIMERPTFSNVLANLPEYGHITFSDCVACSATTTSHGSTAQPVTMTDATGQTLSSATLESDWDCSFARAS